MTTNELQNIVMIEAFSLILIMLIILSAFRRWKLLLGISIVAATATLFTAWSTMVAFGSLLVYGPASLLLWFELDRQADVTHDAQRKMIRIICWTLLAFGVALIILKNIYNIYLYLR